MSTQLGNAEFKVSENPPFTLGLYLDHSSLQFLTIRLMRKRMVETNGKRNCFNFSIVFIRQKKEIHFVNCMVSELHNEELSKTVLCMQKKIVFLFLFLFFLSHLLFFFTIFHFPSYSPPSQIASLFHYLRPLNKLSIYFNS